MLFRGTDKYKQLIIMHSTSEDIRLLHELYLYKHAAIAHVRIAHPKAPQKQNIFLQEII